jgi:murein DD-endopeptidase MepM/ murein hydrolase activator NlpD
MNRPAITIGIAVASVILFLFCAAITTVAAGGPTPGQSAQPGGDCTGPISATGWTRPACGPIGSGFRTPARPGHDGIDIMAPNGSTVRAAAAGTITLITCNAHLEDGTPYSCDVPGSPSVRGCGWYLELTSRPNIVTRYCHLLRRPTLAIGQPVAAGQPIGLICSSGNSSGPHLHFEAHLGSPATEANAIDPAAYLYQQGVDLR